MPNINGIINKSNIAKLSKEKKKRWLLNVTVGIRLDVPLEGKCKQECVVYKVEVYSDPGNDRNSLSLSWRP